MGNYLLIVPLFLALAIGWFLGRRDWRKQKLENFLECLKEEYFSGLSHLVDNQTDAAIDSFVKLLQYNAETIPIRLALGTLFRRRGDIQRAIQLHQEVMAHPSLTHKEYSQVQIALSQDYLAAGLLDRAEVLLLDVLEGADKELQESIVILLIEIYQQVKEWDKALDIAERFEGVKNDRLVAQLAHFYCEQAKLCIEKQQWRNARSLLKQALQCDRDCVRASLMSADVEIAESRWKAAIKPLRSVQEQDPEFVSEAVSRLATCYRQLQSKGELKQLLERSMNIAPSTTSMLLIAEEIASQQGDSSAGAYVIEQLKRRPSVKGFNRLIDLHLGHASESAEESLNLLRGLTGQLEQSKPRYRCQSCGFSGRVLHWQCPGCKQWGSSEAYSRA